MIGITTGIQPCEHHTISWTSPKVTGELGVGLGMLAIFALIESRVSEPMFHLRLFRIRAFTAGNAASLLMVVARSGLQFVLVIWLQGIWLPEHGYSCLNDLVVDRLGHLPAGHDTKAGARSRIGEPDHPTRAPAKIPTRRLVLGERRSGYPGQAARRDRNARECVDRAWAERVLVGSRRSARGLSIWERLEGVEDVVDFGAAGVVGVDVDESDDGVAVDDQDGRHRQDRAAVRAGCSYIDAEPALRGEAVL
jgi:hypothetical protein